MRIINRNAARILFDRMAVIERRPQSWRCIHLNLSHARYRPELITHFFIKPIIQLLVEEEGDIYLCEDGDIVILFSGAAKPILTKLASHFADINTNTREGIFKLFDLGVHRQHFFELCSDKLHTAQGAVA